MQKGGVVKLVGGWSAGAEDKVAEYYYPGGLSTAPRDSIVPEEIADFVAPNDSNGVLTLILAIIGLVSVIVVGIAFGYYKNHPIVKPTSFNLGLIQIACMILGVLQLFTMVGRSSNLICAVDLFLIPIAFSMYYSILLVKNYRIYMLFNFSGLGMARLTDSYLALYAVLFTFPNVIAIVVLSAVSPPLPKAVMTGVLTYEWTCASVNVLAQFVAIRFMIIYSSFLLLLNLFIAFKNKNVNSRYNDTKLIGISIYNVTMVVVFCVPILFTTSLGFRTRHLIKVICIFYVTMFNLISGFAFKAYQAFTNRNEVIKENSSTIEHNTEKAEGKFSSMVIIRRIDGMNQFFSQAKPRFMLSETKNSAVFYQTVKTSLEDKEIKTSCFGDIWDVNNCNVIKSNLEFCNV
jgi:hypothetical protein